MTGHTEVEDYDILLEPRQLLRSHGIHLAIDDAGSGYASLQRLVALAPDSIKLDRALITGVDHDKARQALVGAIVMFALGSGATVLGEGVETVGELETLADLGVDTAQGYVLGRPTTSAEDWQKWADAVPIRAGVPIRSSVYVIPVDPLLLPPPALDLEAAEPQGQHRANASQDSPPDSVHELLLGVPPVEEVVRLHCRSEQQDEADDDQGLGQADQQLVHTPQSDTVPSCLRAGGALLSPATGPPESGGTPLAGPALPVRLPLHQSRTD